MKVLVAEDNIIIRNLLCGLLKKWGYQVVVARDGEEAWAHLQESAGPRLAILDWMMPGIDGIEVCRRIRAQQGSGYVYVILLSARTEQEDIVAALEEGADDYMTKPFHADELRARLRSAVRVLQLETELQQQAHYDALTGLPSRVLLADRLQQALHHAARHNERLAFFYIDLDRFKVVNDSLGHAAGDELLRQAAARLRTGARDCDTLSRVGGDEFVLVASPLPSSEEAAGIARRLLASLEEPFDIDGYRLRVTASIGIAIYPDDGGDMSSLQQNADAAMYESKRRDRHGFQFFNSAIRHASRWQLEIEQRLSHAVEDGQLSLDYQPICAFATGRMIAAEALVRWNHPRLGTIMPSAFIPIAEETGQIQDIGAWVTEAGCRQAQSWSKKGIALPVSINVSAQQFAREDFVDSIERVLAKTGLDPRLLQLELTETVIMRDLRHVTGVLQQLRALGIGIWIDDFGTGYSCFSYLHRLPVDTVKISGEFVQDIGVEKGALPLIGGIVTLAHNLGMVTVAEGVETREQFDALRSAGCDQAQGYLLGRPATPENLEAAMVSPFGLPALATVADLPQVWQPA
jgi:diguanylate cyclase (GGDEF)-like protein